MTLARNAEQITAQIQQIRQSIPARVRLIAVTKLLPVEVVRIAYRAGLRDFGESRVQEAIEKQALLADLPDLTWHLIGHLQTNKIRKAVEHFDWIHSIDSLKVAEKLNLAAIELNRRPQCCLQVKMVPDPPKFGFDQPDLEAALPELNQLTQLRLIGLMTIPPLHTPTAALGDLFAQTQALANHINQRQFSHIHIQELSMGMSGDYIDAIAAGATMVRLGTILFGPRPA